MRRLFLFVLLILTPAARSAAEEIELSVVQPTRKPAETALICQVLNEGTIDRESLASFAEQLRSQPATTTAPTKWRIPKAAGFAKALTIQRTDDAGRVRISQPDEKVQFMIVHESGYAFRGFEDLTKNHMLQLTEWSRIEGEVQTGLVGEQVSQVVLLESDSIVDGNIGTFRDVAKTDEHGHFCFERVPKGKVSLKWIFVELDPTNDELCEHHPAAAECSIIADAPVTRNVVLRCSGQAAVGLVPNLPPRKEFDVTCFLSRMPEEQRKAIIEQRALVPATVDASGRVRIENLQPGEYTVCVEAYSRADQTRRRTLVSRGETAFTIAEDTPQADPIDIGEILLVQKP